MKSPLQRLAEWVAQHPRLYAKDLARRYGRTVRTIQRWRKAGRLPPGKSWTLQQIQTFERKMNRENNQTSITQTDRTPGQNLVDGTPRKR